MDITGPECQDWDLPTPNYMGILAQHEPNPRPHKRTLEGVEIVKEIP